MRRRAPRPLGIALETLTSTLSPPGLLSDAQRVWKAAVGEGIARAATPVGERDGTLVVACESASWAHELELLGPALVAKINALLGGERLSALRCRVGH